METLSTIQDEVNVKTEKIRQSIQDPQEFILSNFHVLKKIPYWNIFPDSRLIVSNCEKNHLHYQAPEVITVYTQLISFAMALDETGVEPSLWIKLLMLE
jgi:hypothetical protein